MPKKTIEQFITDFQYLFGVQNLERKIILKPKDLREKTYAEIEYREDYQDLKLYIYPAFLKLDRAEQCKVLIHELSHPITNPLAMVAENLLDGKLETKEHLRREEERCTSRIENILHLLLTDREYSDKYRKWLKH